jgi:hypothetical protein
MAPVNFLEEVVRLATPTESVLAWVLIAGALFILLSLLWMTVQIANANSGWKRRLCHLLFLIPFLLAGATALLIYLKRDESGIAFLATVASAALLLLVVLVGSVLRWPLSRWPVRLFVVGILLAATPFAYTHLIEPIVFHFVRPPYVAEVNGETHVTLTGIANYDYAKLVRFQDAVVLQMANPEVTDETLKKLANFKQLKELDLNDTAITDAGLAELRNCPRLEKLRLKGTKITDAGFHTYLMDRENLMEIDMRDTVVASKTLRDWKKQKEDRKYLK